MIRLKNRMGMVRWVMEPGDRVCTDRDPCEGLEITMPGKAKVTVRANKAGLAVYPDVSNMVEIRETDR